MRRFSELYEKLDTTNSTNKKVEALTHYFHHAPPDDAAWAIYFLSGRRIKRLITRAPLKRWLIEASGMEEWIVSECYSSVGDLAETISLLVPSPQLNFPEEFDQSLTHWVEDKILSLKDMEESEQGIQIQNWWFNLPTNLCFIVTKLMTGALRVGISQLLVARALAQIAKLPRPVILHRMMGDWEPTEKFFRSLMDPNTESDDISRPYPFYLASPLDKTVHELGKVDEWLHEWKWDGIRAQLIKRENRIFIWSRGEELVTHRFPEITEAAESLPDGVVLDGELLAWREGRVQSFNELQKRLGRKKVSCSLRREIPVHFLAYDLIENSAKDIRSIPLEARRRQLEKLLSTPDEYISVSPLVKSESWELLSKQRDSSRDRLVEGLMLKHKNSVYETGRKRGNWWKWKVDPLTIDAVLLYAQAGSGRRANLFTDYTFAVWSDEQLLPVAKAYSGLDDKEIQELDRWVRRNTQEKFGPVRSVTIEHVFEIGFEGINASKRHKSGVALRFPRILRWRKDMKPTDANTLDMIKDLLNVYG